LQASQVKDQLAADKLQLAESDFSIRIAHLSFIVLHWVELVPKEISNE